MEEYLITKEAFTGHEFCQNGRKAVNSQNFSDGENNVSNLLLNLKIFFFLFLSGWNSLKFLPLRKKIFQGQLMHFQINRHFPRLIVHWPVIEWSQISEILRKLTLFTSFLLFQLLPYISTKRREKKTHFFQAQQAWILLEIMMNDDNEHRLKSILHEESWETPRFIRQGTIID